VTLQIPPTPTYEEDIKRLLKYYRKGLRDVVRIIEGLDTKDVIRQQTYNDILRDIAIIFTQLNNQTHDWVQETIQESFEDSQARALLSIGIATTLLEARSMISTTEITRVRAKQLIEDTFEDLLQATQFTEKKVKQLVRDIVAESLRNNALQNVGMRQSKNEILDRLLKKGFSKTIKEETFIGIIDRAGRRWDLQTYVSMVVQTKIQQAQIEGARVEALENEADLAIISSHGARDSCKHFEGMIISLEGRTKGYRTLSELRASGLIFHPNCRHTVHPIGSLEAVPLKLMQKHETAQETANKALENPKETKSIDQKAIYEASRNK
jgi:hypothetical protein